MPALTSYRSSFEIYDMLNVCVKLSDNVLGEMQQDEVQRNALAVRENALFSSILQQRQQIE